MTFTIYKNDLLTDTIYYCDWDSAARITGFSSTEVEKAYRRRRCAEVHSFSLGDYYFLFSEYRNSATALAGVNRTDNSRQTDRNYFNNN